MGYHEICLGPSTITAVEIRKNHGGFAVERIISNQHDGNPKAALSNILNQLDRANGSIAVTGRKYGVLKSYKILLMLVMVLAASTLSGQTVVKLGTLAPVDTEWYNLLVQMGQDWESVTDGEVKVKIYASGVLGDERDMVRKMRIGQIHSAAITAEGLSSINPDVAVYFLPRFFEDQKDINRVRETISGYLEKGIEENGFKVLFWADVGWTYWFTTESIGSCKDLKKLKQFSWAGDFQSDRIWTQAGFDIVPLAMTDVFSGFQTGLVESISLIPLFALSTQVFGIANNMLDMKWGLLTGAVVIKLDTWGRISAENQGKMIEVANYIGREYQDISLKMSEDAIRAMQDNGLQINKPSAEDLADWDRFLDEWQPVLRGTMIPEEIYDRVTELKKDEN